MKKNLLLRLFAPSDDHLATMTIKEQTQIPMAIYSSFIFILGFTTTMIAEIIRKTYTPVIFSGVTVILFIISLSLIRKDKVYSALMIDTIGVLNSIIGIVFFLETGNTTLELYRSVAFLITMAIFNQIFAIKRNQLIVFYIFSMILWIASCIVQAPKLLLISATETISCIAIGSVAFIGANTLILLLNKQNRVITNNAIAEQKKAKDAFVTIKQVLDRSSEGLEIGNVLNSEVQTVTKSVTDIDGLYQYLSSEATSLTEKASTVSSSSVQLMSQVKKMQDSVESQNAAITETSAAMTEISANLSNINEIADKRKASMTEMVKTLDSQLTLIKKVVTEVSKVQASSDGIAAFVETVNNIASQTNLLAMNASIEAAHAGNAGKGFAVIAMEIRKLSEQTAKNAENISDLLKNNTLLVKSATESASNCANYTDNSNTELRNTILAIEEILAGIGEMDIGTREVMKALQNIVDESQITNDLVVNSVNEISQQDEAIRHISDFTTTLQERVNSLDSLLTDIKIAITNVHDAAVKNAETSNNITETLSTTSL